MVSVVRCMNEVTLRQDWLALGWVTICGQEYHLGVYPAIKVNSALHPSEVAKSSTCLNLIQAPGWDEGGKVTSAGWQVTLCDPNGM